MRALSSIAAFALALSPPVEVQRPGAPEPVSGDSEPEPKSEEPEAPAGDSEPESQSEEPAAPAPPTHEDGTEAAPPEARWGPKNQPTGSDGPPTSDQPASKPEPGPAPGPRVAPANRRLVIAGNIVTGIGGAGFVAMVVGLVLRDNSIDRLDSLGRRDEVDVDRVELYRRRRDLGTGLAIGGGAAAGVFFAAGITMIVVGNKRERKRREALENQSIAPTLGHHHVGFSWQIAF